MNINFDLSRESFGFSRENIDGVKGGGSRGKDCEKLSPCVEIKPSETIDIMKADRSGVITHIWFGGILSNDCIIRMYYEDSTTPSVEVPIPAFFGLAYDKNLYLTNDKGEQSYPAFSSAMMMVAPSRSYNCYFEIPFRKSIRITIENRGKESNFLYYMISGYYGKVSDDALYFHAFYNQQHPVTKGVSYEALNVKGKGFFAGILLAVGLNGNATCFVEGETKFYIDDDKYPTMNYTGTEDYFCGSYAFGNDAFLHKYQTYQGLYAGMYGIMGDMKDNYNNQQRFYLYRFHVVDPVYFKKNLRFTLDNLGWTGPRYDDYTSVSFYYLTEPTKLPKDLLAAEEINMK